MTQRTYKAIIVDDEALARQAIRQELARRPDVDVLDECSNGYEAVKAITERKPDIVFLDVQMPKLNGFEVLELLQEDFAVIFVTAHEEHALKAFDANAIDYLLKPFSGERFDTAVEKAITALRSGKARNTREKAGKIRPEGLSDRLLVREGSRVHVIPLDDISHIEAEDDYVAIVAKGKRHLKHQSMADVESHLPPDRFVRVHRSTILNLDYLARLELYAKDSRVAILKDGTKLNVSRSGYEKLKGFLEN